MDYSLRPFTEGDKDIIYNWRNSERIRLNMYNDQPIPYDKHDQWFKEVLDNQMSYYRLFMYRNQPLGLVSFKKDSSKEQTCVWGFYIGENNVPKGSGTIMGILGLDYAFQCLNMKTVIGEVLDFNYKSKKFHQKLGFHQDFHYKNTIKRTNEWIDVIRFVLCKDKWEVQKKKFNLNFSTEVQTHERY
jgi:UDP-4-amino-4,6-dideoxy-N-acetyl-beta-L-altrosamine N-acetyltransferase